MVEYLKKFPHFGIVQGLPDKDILELVKLLMPQEWQKELIIEGFDSATQGLAELVEFYECLETAKKIFHTQGEGQQKDKIIKYSGECYQPTRSTQRKGSYQAENPLEENANKKSKTRIKNINLPVCPLYGPTHNMNSCKVI